MITPENDIRHHAFGWSKLAVIYLLSLMVGVGRLTIPGHDLSWPGTYEAFAHIWVGMLLVFCFRRGTLQKSAIICLVITSVIEIVMFKLR